MAWRRAARAAVSVVALAGAALAQDIRPGRPPTCYEVPNFAADSPLSCGGNASWEAIRDCVLRTVNVTTVSCDAFGDLYCGNVIFK